MEGMEALGKSLKINSTLVELSLYNMVSNDSNGLLLSTLVNALGGKTTKLSIDMSYDDKSDFTEASIDPMAQFSAPLLSLHLGQNNLQPYFIEVFSQGIRDGTLNIQSWKLDYAGINDDVTIDLFNSLIQNKDTCSLVELSLDYVTGVTQIGAQYIVDSLSLTNLQRIHLNEIPIGDGGVQQIATYLNDTELTELSLDDVGMGDCGLIALSNALKSNTKLITLDIYENSNVSIIGKDALLETLRDYNKTLSNINLKKEPNEDHLGEQIHFYVALNKAKRAIFCDSDLFAVTLLPLIFEKHNCNPSIVYWMLARCPLLYFQTFD